MSRLLQEIQNCAAGPARRGASGAWSMDFTFPPSFMGFDGHFPGRPILPGMVQIMAATLVAGSGGPLALEKISRAKFSRIVEPGETIRVEADLAEKNSRIQAVVRILVGEETAATMTLFLSPPDDMPPAVPKGIIP